MKLGDELLRLPVKQRDEVFGHIVTAGIIYYNYGDWRMYFREVKKKVIGVKFRIYSFMQQMSDTALVMIIQFICESR